MISFFLPLTFFLLSLGQIGRISFFGQEVNGYWYEIVLFMYVVFLFFKYRFAPIHRLSGEKKFLALFMGVLLVSYIFEIAGFSLFQNAVSFLYLARLSLYFKFFIYFSYDLKKNPKYLAILKKSTIFFVIATIIFSVAQYLLYPDLRNLYYLGWDPHLYRIFGTFFDTSVAGAILGLLFLIVLLEGEQLIHNTIIRITVLSFLFVLVGLSFSRSLYIGIALTLGIYFVMKKNWKVLFLSAFLFGLLIIIIPKPFGEGVNLLRTSTISSRSLDNQTALKLWQKKPVIGWGYNRIRYVKEKFHLLNPEDASDTHAGASFHSSFLIVLVTAGVVGLISYIAMLVQFGLKEERVRVVLLFLCILSLFDNILLHPFILILFLIYSAWRFSYPYYSSR